MKDIQALRGVIPAMMTCFDEKGKFDGERQRQLTDFLVEKGVGGLYLTGSTGEAFLMNEEERCAVIEEVARQNRKRVPLIAHVGDIGTIKSVRLARQAFASEVDALSSVPPFYFRFSEDEIFSYYQALSDSTPLPMIIYNIALAGGVSSRLIERLARLPRVMGMKYTYTSHQEIMQFKEKLGSGFMIYSGCDEMALSGITCGADGIIGSFYNVIPEIFLQMFQAVEENDLRAARDCQQVADAVIALVLQYPYFAAIKRMLAWIGVDAGYVREPFASLSPLQEDEIKTGLRRIRSRYGAHGLEILEKLPG